MESRGRNILKKVDDRFNLQARTIDEPHINENFEKSSFEEYNSFKKTNATDKINSTSLVKKSIGGNDFENQNPIPMTPDS